MSNSENNKATPSVQSEAVASGDDLLATIMGSMRERWNAPFAAISPDYETWKAKSNLVKLLDGDTNPAWEAKLRGERAAENRFWSADSAFAWPSTPLLSKPQFLFVRP